MTGGLSKATYKLTHKEIIRLWAKTNMARRREAVIKATNLRLA
jgi:hypothetical protein